MSAKYGDKRKLALIGLAFLLAACFGSPLPASESEPNSQQVIGTAQSLLEGYQTETAAAPTVKPTELPTPTVTIEPRVPSLSKWELFYGNPADENTDCQFSSGTGTPCADIGVWESRDAGGYFSNPEELENPEQYVYMDFSHEGQIRIVESSALDNLSWGLFTLREWESDSGNIVPISRISKHIWVQIVRYGRDLEIFWGDFREGTVFYFPDIAFSSLSTSGFPEEKLKNLILPTKDSRFACQETDSFYGDRGYINHKHGLLCKYVG